MRPTIVAQSGMPTGKHYTGWWGNMGGPKQKGVIQYTISPFQTRAMAGAFKGYIFNGFTRIAHQAPYFAIPFALGYGIISWGKSKNAYLNSKEGHLLHAEH